MKEAAAASAMSSARFSSQRKKESKSSVARRTMRVGEGQDADANRRDDDRELDPGKGCKSANQRCAE